MAKYHINAKGEVKECRASKRPCRFGGEAGGENHYSSKEEAYAVLEDRAYLEGIRKRNEEMIRDLSRYWVEKDRKARGLSVPEPPEDEEGDADEDSPKPPLPGSARPPVTYRPGATPGATNSVIDVPMLQNRRRRWRP